MTFPGDIPAHPLESVARRLLAEINADPELRELVRRDLLGEEILDLPAKLANLTGVVERLAGTVEELVNAVAGLRQEFNEFRDATNTRLDRLEGKVDQLNGKVEHMGGKVEHMGGKIEHMGGKIEHMDGKVDRVEGYVGDIRGLHYEQYCIATVNAALSRRLRRARLVERDSIADHLDDALDSGAIDYRQHHAATVTDIIVQGFCRRRQAMVKVAVEVSIRLNRHDIDRASERAGILSLATGETFVAYCVGHRQWSEQLERYADEMDVAIVHYPWENLDSPPIDNE